MKKIISILSSIFCFSSVFAQNNVGAMNVLFIGNSYTHYNNMPSVFEDIAESRGQKINVEMNARSSHTFKMHSERPEMYEHIKSKKWDYIILQGFSRELSHSVEHLDSATVPYVKQIIDSIYVNNSCTNVLLFMTWGYKNGFSNREEIDSYTKMSDSVQKGYEYLSNVFALPIVPVGNVWREVQAKSKIELYQEDFQHPSIYGSYLIAYTFYSAIFKAPPLNTLFTKKIKKEEAQFLQETSYGYVIDNLDTFNLRQNTLKVRYERTKKGKYFVYCNAIYPNATSIVWSFGDGKKADTSDVTYQYRKAGTYWVTLTVEEPCGTRVIKRKVKFEKPKKPKRKKRSKPKIVNNSTRRI